MRECVMIDGVRSPNVRAHKDKGWFRNRKPDEILTAVYDGLFARNPSVAPEAVDGVFCGCSHISGPQFDIGRLGWLAGGFPETTPTNTITMMCPSGMAAIQHGARAIMCGEGDIYIASGVEDMLSVPQGSNCEPPERFMKKYGMPGLNMGLNAERIAEVYNIPRADAENMAFWSHRKAHEATEAGKFKGEIIPMEGIDEKGNSFMVDRDQWIRPNVSMEEMAAMKTPFKEGGQVTAATSSPLTCGACAMILMSRDRADELGLTYHVKYAAGALAGCDPRIMGIGPVYAVPKALSYAGITMKDVDVWELNEAFGGQSLAVLRELGLGENAPCDNVNVWGGALALGHPQGESGARIVITLNSIMKTDFHDARYGCATLCGGLGNAGAILLERAE